MGYYTEFELSACELKMDNSARDHISELSDIVADKINKEIDKMNVFKQGCDIRYTADSYSKWCDHIEDMCLLSSKFDNILFRLNGFGEDSGDIWVEYYYGGKFQRCPVRMEFDDFDVCKLKNCQTKNVYSYEF